MLERPGTRLDLLEDVAEAVYGTTGLRARIEPRKGEEAHGIDAYVAIERGKRIYRYAAQVRQVVRKETINKPLLPGGKTPRLLVTPYLTLELAERCRQEGVEFMDAAGNAYLNQDGLFVLITGRRPEKRVTPVTFRAFNATGLRVIFLLLCQPDLVKAPYRTLARTAGVAVGVVGRVFADLRGRGFIVGGDEPTERRLANLPDLLEAWVTNYPLRLRPKLRARRFKAEAHDWRKQFVLDEENAFWGGEVGAERLTKYLVPENFTIYTKQDLKKIVVENQLRADPRGEIEILEVFWDPTVAGHVPGVAPPLLVYADLLATLDPRNHEVAKTVYDKYLAPAFRKH